MTSMEIALHNSESIEPSHAKLTSVQKRPRAKKIVVGSDNGNTTYVTVVSVRALVLCMAIEEGSGRGGGCARALGKCNIIYNQETIDVIHWASNDISL